MVRFKRCLYSFLLVVMFTGLSAQANNLYECTAGVSQLKSSDIPLVDSNKNFAGSLTSSWPSVYFEFLNQFILENKGFDLKGQSFSVLMDKKSLPKLKGRLTLNKDSEYGVKAIDIDLLASECSVLSQQDDGLTDKVIFCETLSSGMRFEFEFYFVNENLNSKIKLFAENDYDNKLAVNSASCRSQ